AVLALCEPGDEVIVFEPYYDSYGAAIALAGGVRRAVTMRPDGPGGRFTFDPAELRAAVTPRTKLLLLNSPHNPTGTVLTPSELAEVAAVCRNHDLVAITDEVYEHLTYDGTEHLPLAALDGMRERTVSISSAGKTFSATGWKIGWVCAPPELVRAVTTVKQFLTFTASGPFQAAVAYALEHELDWVEGSRASHQERRDLLAEGLQTLGLTVHRPAGTYFIQTDVRSVGVDDGTAFARALPHAAGVAAIPTAAFYDDKAAGRPYVRFAFCKRPEVLAEGVARLTAYARERRQSG
ncbi:MAG: aminotransferase class I/II-fold pyridoxal phosphate-dependent enzyme, partial [Frankiaceae bacterium]